VVGSGSVVRSPAAARHPYGSVVRFTAVPAAGNYFALWGNAASGTNNPLHFTVTNANPTVTAVFAALAGNQRALTVLADGFGEVSASPRGNRFGNGTNVTLTALPGAGQSFLGWGGDASGAANPLTVTMTASKVITAQFTKRPRLEILDCGGRVSAEDLHLLVTGGAGDWLLVEGTGALAPGLATWSPLAIVTNEFGVSQVNDTTGTNRTQRFYRATRLGP
jgi:hypothetical protein